MRAPLFSRGNNPFSLAPDPRFAFASSSYQAAVEMLQRGLDRRIGVQVHRCVQPARPFAVPRVRPAWRITDPRVRIPDGDLRRMRQRRLRRPWPCGA